MARLDVAQQHAQLASLPGQVIGAKLTPANTMKKMATASINGESKAPMLASQAAKPLGPIVLHMCMKA